MQSNFLKVFAWVGVVYLGLAKEVSSCDLWRFQFVESGNGVDGGRGVAGRFS